MLITDPIGGNVGSPILSNLPAFRAINPLLCEVRDFDAADFMILFTSGTEGHESFGKVASILTILPIFLNSSLSFSKIAGGIFLPITISPILLFAFITAETILSFALRLAKTVIAIVRLSAPQAKTF
jgi:hypothetical protein